MADLAAKSKRVGEARSEACNILDLNDFCIQRIFHFLAVKDFGSVAEVCERFRGNAQIVFPLKYKPFTFLLPADNWTTRQMENFFKNFGKFIVELLIYYKDFKMTNVTRPLESLARHLSVLPLMTLKVQKMKLEGVIVHRLRPLLARMQALHLVNCTLSNAFVDSLRSAVHLKRFTAFETIGDFQLLRFNLPKLEVLHIDHAPGVSMQQAQTFFELNSQLKEVVIRDCLRLENAIFSRIAQHLPHIEELEFGLTRGAIPLPLHRGAFKSLTSLTIYCLKMPIASVIKELAATNVPLEHLSLMGSAADETLVDAIVNLKKLKTLNLHDTGNLHISNWLRICRNLEQLTDLILCKCGTLDSSGLLELIWAAKKLKKLNLGMNHFVVNAEIYDRLIRMLGERAAKIPLEVFVSKRMLQQINENVPAQTNSKLLLFRSLQH